MTTYNTDHKSYYEKNKDRIKQYYLDNKERIIKRNSEYNLKNKEKISRYQYFYFQENKHKIYAKTKFVHQYNYYYRQAGPQGCGRKEDGRASDIKTDKSKSTKPTNKKNQLSTVKIKTSDDIICKFN